MIVPPAAAMTNIPQKGDREYVHSGFPNVTEFRQLQAYYNVSSNVTDFRHLREYKVAMWMVIWLLPMIIFLGTIGNVSSFLVLTRRRMRRTSVYFYLAVLACADTSVLYFSGFKTWIRALTGAELLHVSPASCKIIMFLFLVSIHMSAWLVVAITADRFLATWFPFKASAECMVRRARRITVVGLIFLAIYNIHVFWTIHLDKVKGKLVCSGKYNDYFVNKIFPWVKLATYSVVPFMIVLVLNIGIIFRVASSRSIGTEVHRTSSKSFMVRRHSSHNRVTIMLMSVSIIWLLLTGPFVLYTFLTKKETTSIGKARKFLLKIVCFLLMYSNHAVNFYLYCILGRKFRQELWHFLCLRLCKRKLSRPGSGRTLRTGLGKRKEMQLEAVYRQEFRRRSYVKNLAKFD